MKLGEIVVHMDNYNFTKFHQNQMKKQKSFINSLFFCSEFQSVSRIVKFIHSAPEANETKNWPHLEAVAAFQKFFVAMDSILEMEEKMFNNHI